MALQTADSTSKQVKKTSKKVKKFSINKQEFSIGLVLAILLTVLCVPAVLKTSSFAKGVNTFPNSVFCFVTFIFCFTAIGLPFHVGRKHIVVKNMTVKDLIFLASLLGISSFLTFGINWVQVHLSGVPQVFSATQDIRLLVLLLPTAAAAMMVVTFFDVGTSILFSIVACIFWTVILYGSLWTYVYFLFGSFLGIHSLYPYRDRLKPIRAGMWVGILQGFLVALFLQLKGNTDWSFYPVYVLAAILGGILSGILASGLIPLVEYLFDYATDTKLIELSTMDHPLLRELMVQAPGTYHHSIIVGNMVEVAAKSIGANSLLAKVAAYYHDIGKIKKPLYFIENQFDCENRHEKLAPSMSSLILISHVKDGVELARQYKLGKPIIEIIRQHHGTSLISYFYQKALSMREKALGSKKGADPPPVNEEDFRYPGPKPQTKEAGLVMLADMVEAACRSIPNPTPARIQGTVNKLINQAFVDGQLDECELTLKDLHQIAKHFIQILSTIHHKRIEYPETARAKEAGNGKCADNKSTANSSKSESNKAGNGTDLKRLGLQ